MKQSCESRTQRPQNAKAALMLEPPGELRFITETPKTEMNECASPEPDEPRPTTWNPKWLRWAMLACIAAIAIFGVRLYVHTLNFPFQFDDHIYLVGSPFVMEMKEFLINRTFHDIANHSVALGLGYDPSVNFILRPVAYLTFHLNYLMNGFNPAGWRAVNIGIHCVNGILLFLLLTHLLRKSPKAASLPAGSVLFIPLAASLLFVAHPLQTEAVTYIVQRFTSLVGFFVLSSLLLHFLSLSAQRRGVALLLRICAVTATIAGMLTKETMFTAPLLIVMIHVVVIGGTMRRACWQALPHLLCMLIIPSLALLTSHAQAGTSNMAAAMQIAASSKDPEYQLHYFFTQLGVLLEYIRLIIFPQDLNVDRQYQLATSFQQLRVWLSACVLLALVVAAWRYYRSHRNDLRRVLISAGVFWYFLRLVVSSSFVPLDDLMVDHRTYGASMGLLTALACGLDILRTRQWSFPVISRWAAPAGLAAWVTLLGAATFNRNKVWQSETSLWSDAALKSPGKARPWDNLGVCHYMEGRQGEAIECLVKAATINPRHLPAYIKLGVIYNAQSKFADAADWARKGLTLFPDAAPLHYNLGVALCGLGKVPDGLAAMLNAVKYLPTDAASHAALGQIYRHLGNYAKSLNHYRQAESLGARDPAIVAVISELETRTAVGQAGQKR